MRLVQGLKRITAGFAPTAASLGLLIVALLLAGCPGKNNSPTTPNQPTNTPAPSSTPTNSPTVTASSTPSGTPTKTGTPTATGTPTFSPTVTATFTITDTPTDSPTATQSFTPTATSTSTPIHQLITSWGGYAVPGGSGKFENPVGVAWDYAYSWLYVADGAGGDLQKFRSNGTSGSDVFDSSSSYVPEPEGVAVDDFGNVYVADYSHEALVVYNSSGVTTNVVQNWTGGYGSFNSFLATAVSPGGIAATIACANAGVGEIDFFSIGVTATGVTGFITDITGYNARGLAYDSSGNLWVSDSNGPSTHNLYRFAPGATSPNLTVSSANSINFSGNEGVCVDSNGYVYLADTGNSRVVEMDGSGNYYFTISSGLSGPYGVCADPSNDIYVSDINNDKVYAYGP